MDERRGMRMGIVIGVLAAAVVALLGIVAFLLLSDDDSDTTGPPPEADRAVDSEPEEAEVCEARVPISVRVDLVSSGLTCDEAVEVLRGWKAAIEAEKGTGMAGTAPVGDWTCTLMPGADYPILLRCDRDGAIFVGIDSGQPTPKRVPPPPGASDSPGERADCGALPGALSNNVFDIRGVGVSCDTALIVVQSWLDLECGAVQPGTVCEVLNGFECVLESRGFELTSVRCRDEARRLSFSTGA